ncbi:alpha/beta hydrolase [Desulfovibrio sulfodismutans]|uniref:Alpha/beta hydrolase n=1 Tax=Desulfolutivibrio sulfodismutans TaxID=63561 RepID=A0A7K3NHU2_9BACT|nr:alpha/beta hydrolase [Desulfolutivibrio sulfodismutans]NDY55766.1 alpha/beta hydrolase [Desulfolutivibrio sulfodismutans]
MQSLKSRLVNALIRNRHYFQGKLRRDVFTMDSSIQAFRDDCEKAAARMSRIPPGVQVGPTTMGGIAAEWLRPAAAPGNKAILYVHGGGYVSGSCADHRGFVSAFANRLGYAALTYDYRLAPEHPYPAAVEDSIAAYRGLLVTHRPGDILVAGESAGGGLALALLFAIRKYALPMPCAAVAISPWTDLTCSSAGYSTRNERSVAPKDSWVVFANHYAGGADRRDPLMSPLFGNQRGFPPLLINSAKDDELYDDGEKFARRAREAGVDVVFRPGVGMIHCYPLLSPMFREAALAMDEISCFASKHLG